MFEKVLVGADGSSTAARAVRTAAELAKATGAELHVVTGYEPDLLRTGERPGDYVERVTGVPASVLESLRPMLDGLGVQAEYHAATGEPAEAIVRTADRIGADLIVVGNRGMKGMRRILGSVPNSVAHSANCSVLIVDTVSD